MEISRRENITYAPQPNVAVVHARGDIPDEVSCSSAYVLAFREGQVLMAQLDRGVDIPGGHIDPGETVYDAMVREAQEETGIVIKSAQVFAVQTIEVFADKPENYPYPYPTSHQAFYITTDFEMGEFTEDEDSEGPIWIDFENINDVPWFQKHPEVFDAALKVYRSL